MEREPQNIPEISKSIEERDLELIRRLESMGSRSDFKAAERRLYSQIDVWEKKEISWLDGTSLGEVSLGIRVARIMFKAGFPLRKIYDQLERIYSLAYYGGYNLPEQTQERRVIFREQVKEISELLREYGYPNMEDYPTQ